MGRAATEVPDRVPSVVESTWRKNGDLGEGMSLPATQVEGFAMPWEGGSLYILYGRGEEWGVCRVVCLGLVGAAQGITICMQSFLGS